EEVIVYDKRKKDKGIFNLYKKACQIKAKSFDKVYSIHRSHRTSTLLFLSCIPERIGFKDAKLSFLYTEQRNKKFDGHAAIRNLSLLFNDAPEENFDNNLRLFEPELQNISNNVQKIPKNYIVMAPGSAWKTKQWHWQGYLSVAEYYIKQGINIILIGGKEDMAICNKINEKTDVIDFSGKIPLSDTLYIMKNAKLLVCNDSMSLHMASAFKIPTVVIFCATSPKFGFGPWQNVNSRIVEDDTLECKPCRRHGSNKCPNSTEACMKISAQKVIKACKELI
ncbi:MAG: glycosyltransferase family 9 protein, partial [Desulfobacteraceae bacterium]|nr:glycosyltransferase family 9 protein [Desulfobacteraceae bacterium]